MRQVVNMSSSIAVNWQLPVERPEYCLRFILYKTPEKYPTMSKFKLSLAGLDGFPMPPRMPPSSYEPLVLILAITLLQLVILHAH